jgi:nitrogen fixation/metabolism regulation signal transduction histidine kinase
VAAWQEVARRVAHEVGNALTPIRLAVENLRRTRERAPAEIDRALREEGTAILEEVESLRRMVEEFSLFARLPAPRVRACDLGEVARQTLALSAARIAALGVDAEVKDAGAPHVVRGDPDLLGRALGNVVANALDALEGAAEKRLRIVLSATPEGTGPGGAARPPLFESIEVCDTGPGFAKELAGRMFEPYITTRVEKGGTGLGLALVQRVVREHGGSVAAGNGPEGGAYVILELPIAGPSTAPGARAVAADATGEIPARPGSPVPPEDQRLRSA